MKEKKNIDRLFQEKFKDFEVHPSEQVWKNIVAAKKKKEDRKIIPIWWRLGGVAAVALLLITAGIAFWNTTSDDVNAEPTFVEANEKENSNTLEGTDLASDSETSNGVNSEGTSSGLAAHDSETANETPSLKDEKPNEKNTLFGVSGTEGAVANQTPNASQQKINNRQNTYQSPIDNTTTQNNPQSSTDNAVANEEIKENLPQKRSDLIDPTITIDKAIGKDADVAVAEEVTETTEEESNQKSLVEEAARIAEANAQEEDINEKDVAFRRWDVGAVAAPVYYGDFGGSGIDPQFKDNSKTSDVNLSYGVQVSYAVTQKFKVRTGVSNVDLNYNTQDISFTPSNTARTLRGINFSQSASFLDITDRVNPSTALASPEDGFGQGGNSVSNGEIQQNVGYIEIPLEAIYVLSDKRLGVELIGGVSTLVLNNNEVFLESNGLRTNLGTSNALNDVSFTTNLGLGLNYKVTEKVKINLEPSFKYQLNAYSNSVGEFKPYYVGLYTGVNYRF